MKYGERKVNVYGDRLYWNGEALVGWDKIDPKRIADEKVIGDLYQELHQENPTFMGEPAFTGKPPLQDKALRPSDYMLEGTLYHLLRGLDPTPDRGGLKETPARALKAWREWTSGYAKDPIAELKVFEDGAEGQDGMIIVKDIPVYSHCEHHLAAIFGTATVGYIPNGKIVGLSKIPRVVDIFARRLQVQERLGNQIADTIHNGLGAVGVGVVLDCRHMCMESRGICKPGTSTFTSHLRGAFKDDPTVRAEFLSLVNRSK